MDRLFHNFCVFIIIVSIIKSNAQEYTFYPNIGVYYKFHNYNVLWNDARKICMSENATLALPRNDQDVQVMRSIFKPHSEFAYIGMHRYFTYEEYLTLKGKSIQYYHNIWDFPREPNGSPDESCIALRQNGNLHDFLCRDKNPFLCQKSAVEYDTDYRITHHNPNCASKDSEYRHLPGIEKCYKIHMNSRKWADARTICESEGSNLAIIRDKAEEEFISSVFKEPKYTARYTKFPSLAFIGVHELFEKGKYMTVLDEQFSDVPYKNWVSGKPTIEDKHCLAIDKDGRLNDILCHTKAFFICEQPSRTKLSEMRQPNVVDLKPDKFFRKDYTFLGKFGAFYKVHNVKQNFSEAITTCEAEGGELLIPTSREELLAIFKIVDYSITQFYIGIHDRFSEGNFVTLRGNSIHEVYSYWAIGEPNNDNGNEDCIVVRKYGEYLDGNCATKENFVCRKDMKTVTENPICETYDTGYFYELELDRCYKIHTTPRNWQDAFRICRAEEADLIILNSEIEAQMLVKKFSEHPQNSLRGNFEKGLIHIGFHDMFNEGVHLTLEGKLLSQSGYEKWSIYQPDDQNNSEDCGSMFRDGTLNDIRCDARAFFACEKKLSESSNTASANPASGNDKMSHGTRLPDE